jgi:Glycosyl transferases group 1/Glycosyltransferase Family 4
VRIVHVDTGLEMRGGQHQVLLLLKGLRERGHDSVLLARRGGPLFGAAKESGFTVRPCSAFALFRHSGLVGLVHAHDARAHTWAAVAAQCPFVVSRRVAFPVKRTPLSRWKYGRARRYLAVSNYVAGQLREGGVAANLIDWVPDGVDSVPAEPRWNLAGPIVSLASADPQKGRELVSAAADLAEVKVLFSTNLSLDLKGSSLFVYITKTEGLGSAALLALSYGIPVIASRVGGLAEVFLDGISGIYVSNDPPDIAAAIRRVRNDPELAAALSRNGRMRVQDNFTREHLIERTLESYRRVIAA